MAPYPYSRTPIFNLIDHSRCLEEVWWSPYIINKYPKNYPIGKMLTASIKAVVGLIQGEWAAGAPALNIKHSRGWHYIVVNGPPLCLQTVPKGTFPVSDLR